MTARAAARKRSRPKRPESDRALPSELERESSRKSFWLAARVVGAGSGFGIHLTKVTTCARRVDGVDRGLWATDGVVQNGQIKERHEPGGAQAATIIHSVARVGEMRQHPGARREPEDDARVDDRADLYHQYGLEREERRPLRHVEGHLVRVEAETDSGREEQGKARHAIVRELDVLGLCGD